MKLSIVIPCYNEAKNIPLILEKFNNVIRERDIEVILVNNGSFDETKDVLDNLLPVYPFAKSVLVEINQGYGYGILYGLKECTGEYIGWTHADLQTDPADVIRVYDRIVQSGYRTDLYIKGNRKNRPLFDQIFTFGMSVFETLYMGIFLYDINAQPNIFPREFYKAWENPPYDFSLDLYALYMAKAKKLKVIRFKVLFPKRIHGKSSWNTGLKAKIKFIKRTIGFSSSLKKKGIS